MRFLAYLVCGLLSCSQLAAQNEAGIIVGTSKLTSRPSSVDVYGAFNGSLFYSRQFNLSQNIGLKPAIVLYSDRYIMDGLFTKNLTTADFRVTPANYKHSSLSVTGVKVPILFTYTLLDNKKGGWATLNSGVYMDYIFYARQEYKVGNNNVDQAAPLDNKFNAGLNEEMSIAVPITDKGANSFVLSCGLFYQLTEYLNNATSFKPLQFYCKLGFTF